jgi:hypothetical protein
MEFKPGQIIRFEYNHKVIDQDTGEKFKEVLVLHPRWRKKMHGIDLKRLTPAEREVLEAILDTKAKSKPQDIPLVRDILARMDPVRDIRNPMNFYSKFVKGFIRDKDVYRQYFSNLMINPIIVKKQPRLPANNGWKGFKKRTPFGGPKKPTGPTSGKPDLTQQPSSSGGSMMDRKSMLQAANERLKNAGLRPTNPNIPGPTRPKPAQPARPAQGAKPPTAAKPATPAKSSSPQDRLAQLKASQERLKNKKK